MFSRPTPKEIINKVSEALLAIKAGRFQTPLTKHLSGDLDELQLDDAAALPALLSDFLEEIKNAGPNDCYAGTRPPQRSYEPELQKLELFAYAWHSPSFRKRMYLKFGLKNQCYIHVDCHEDRGKNA